MDGCTIEYYDAATPDLAARYRAAALGFRATLQEAFSVQCNRFSHIAPALVMIWRLCWP